MVCLDNGATVRFAFSQAVYPWLMIAKISPTIYRVEEAEVGNARGGLRFRAESEVRHVAQLGQRHKVVPLFIFALAHLQLDRHLSCFERVFQPQRNENNGRYVVLHRTQHDPRPAARRYPVSKVRHFYSRDLRYATSNLGSEMRQRVSPETPGKLCLCKWQYESLEILGRQCSGSGSSPI